MIPPKAEDPELAALNRNIWDTVSIVGTKKVGPLMDMLNEINVNHRAFEDDGFTPLMAISKKGTVADMEKLKKLGADPFKTDRNGNNALHHAVFGENADAVKFILDKNGFDGIALGLHEIGNSSGETPVDVTKIYDVDGNYSENGAFKAIEGAIIANNPDIVIDMKLNHLIYETIYRGRAENIEPLMAILNENNVNHVHKGSGYTPLMAVSNIGNIPAMKKLKILGADPSKIDMNGETALHHAASSGCADAARHLLDKDGFDGITSRLHDVKDMTGRTPIERARGDSVVKVIEESMTRVGLVEEKPLPPASASDYYQEHYEAVRTLSAPIRVPAYTPGLTESVSNAKHEYVRLILHFESELIKHKLAFRYFDFRSFYFMFLPVTLLATLITIIGFLISGVQNDEGSGGGADEATGSVEFSPLLTGSSKQVWSLVVGILGAISTLFNSIGRRTNYQSQADMHKSAVKALEKLCMTVAFEWDWFARNASDPEMAQENNLAADLKSHQASFKAMLDACCDSPVPYRVEQAFTVLEQVYTRQELKNTDKNSDTAPMQFYYHKLWKEHSTYWLWPLKSPSITISVLYKEWKEEMNKDL
mmetsp:Transcript_37636/g.76991  ORF Transcript_37636/g.76991 Transcript_37636/m.76991 type:complete len:593 (+) Transcript_37636:351-2129(+)